MHARWIKNKKSSRLGPLKNFLLLGPGVYVSSVSCYTALLRDGAIAAFLAFLAALLALSLMMRLLRSVSFTPYVIYRLGLGAVLLWIAYG